MLLYSDRKNIAHVETGFAKVVSLIALNQVSSGFLFALNKVPPDLLVALKQFPSGLLVALNQVPL